MNESYRMEHNPDMVIKLGDMSLDGLHGLQDNLLDRAQKLLTDMRIVESVIMEKWGEM